MARLARGRQRRASALRVWPPGDLRQPLLLLRLRPRLGAGVHQDQRLRPYPVWVYLNGHEWAKRQAARAGVEFRALDNGFAACRDADALAAICARLRHADVEAFFARWMGVLPSPFTAAERARYRYRLSVRQLELSDTRVFDRPDAGRAWFEHTCATSSASETPTACRSSSGATSPAALPAPSRPSSSRAASRRRSRLTKSTARSSSTSRMAAPCGPRRPSTTPTTSASTAP